MVSQTPSFISFYWLHVGRIANISDAINYTVRIIYWVEISGIYIEPANLIKLEGPMESLMM